MTGTPETHCTTVNAAVCGPCPLREITELQWLGAVGDADITPFYLGEDVVDVVLKGAHPDRSNTMEGAAALSDDIHLWAGGSAEVGAGRRHLSNGDYVDAVDEAAAAAASSPHAPAEDIPGPVEAAQALAREGLARKGWSGLRNQPKVTQGVGACILRNRAEHCIMET